MSRFKWIILFVLGTSLAISFQNCAKSGFTLNQAVPEFSDNNQSNEFLAFNSMSADSVSSIGSYRKVVNGTTFSCAINTANELICWGLARYAKKVVNYSSHPYYDFRQVQRTDFQTFKPMVIATNVKDVASSFLRFCYVDLQGLMKCLGNNEIVTLRDVESVSVGHPHSCAVMKNSEVMCWGENARGELGNNSKVNSAVPVPVLTQSGERLRNVKKVVAGSGTSCALMTNDELYCWGGGEFQFFWKIYGAIVTSLTAQKVTIPNISIIDFDLNKNLCVLDSSKKIFCYGSRDFGITKVQLLYTVDSPVSFFKFSSNESDSLYFIKEEDKTKFYNTEILWDNPEVQPTIRLDQTMISGDFDEIHKCILTTSQIFCSGSNSLGMLGREDLGSNHESPGFTPISSDVVRPNLPTTDTVADTFSWNTGTFQGCSASPTYTYGNWGACIQGQQTRTASCSNTTGTQTRAVTCVNQTGAVVSDSLCTGTKPSATQSCSASCSGTAATTQSCNSDTFSWNTGTFQGCSASPTYTYGNWGACNQGQQARTASCSNTTGTQTRGVSCVNQTGAVVSDSQCAGAKPSATQSCSASCSGTAATTQSCNSDTFSWNTGTFQGCSANPTYTYGDWGACNQGQQTRTATCSNTTGTQTRGVSCLNQTGAVVSDSQCAGAKPSATQSCSASCSGTAATTQSCRLVDETRLNNQIIKAYVGGVAGQNGHWWCANHFGKNLGGGWICNGSNCNSDATLNQEFSCEKKYVKGEFVQAYVGGVVGQTGQWWCTNHFGRNLGGTWDCIGSRCAKDAVLNESIYCGQR